MATGTRRLVADAVDPAASMLVADDGSANVELGGLVDGVPKSRAAGLDFVGIDLGETAGEEVAEVLCSGIEVMYDFNWAESVRYFAMLRWQLSIEPVRLSSSAAVSVSFDSFAARGDWNTLTA